MERPLPAQVNNNLKISTILIFIYIGILILLQVPLIITIFSLNSNQEAPWTYLAFLNIFLVQIIIFKTIKKRHYYKYWIYFFLLHLVFGILTIIVALISVVATFQSPSLVQLVVIFTMVFVLQMFFLVICQVIWMRAKSNKLERTAAIDNPQQRGTSINQLANSYNGYPQGQIYQPKRLSQNQLNAFDDYAVYQVANDFEREKKKETLNPTVIPDYKTQQVQLSFQEDYSNLSLVPKAIKTILGMYGFDGSQEADNKIIEHILTVENKEELGRGQDSQCSICLCELEAREHIYILTVCKHYFHEQCLKEWMENKQPNCPYCRKDVILPWNQ